MLPRQTQAALLHGCCHRCRRSVTQSFNCIIAFTRVCSSLTIACSYLSQKIIRVLFSHLQIMSVCYSLPTFLFMDTLGEKCTCYPNRRELHGSHSQMQTDKYPTPLQILQSRPSAKAVRQAFSGRNDCCTFSNSTWRWWLTSELESIHQDRHIPVKISRNGSIFIFSMTSKNTKQY